MILFFHVTIALMSVAFAAYGFFLPSKTKLRISYSLIAATLASGTYLVYTAPAHMLQACVAGLFYTGVMIAATVAVRRKLITAVERA